MYRRSGYSVLAVLFCALVAFQALPARGDCAPGRTTANDPCALGYQDVFDGLLTQASGIEPVRFARLIEDADFESARMAQVATFSDPPISFNPLSRRSHQDLFDLIRSEQRPAEFIRALPDCESDFDPGSPPQLIPMKAMLPASFCLLAAIVAGLSVRRGMSH